MTLCDLLQPNKLKHFYEPSKTNIGLFANESVYLYINISNKPNKFKGYQKNHALPDLLRKLEGELQHYYGGLLTSFDMESAPFDSPGVKFLFLFYPKLLLWATRHVRMTSCTVYLE